MDFFTSFLFALTLLSTFVSSAPTVREDVSITATEGDDIILPCDGCKDAKMIVLLWTGPDQEKKLLMVRHGFVQEGYEHKDYTGRVVLQDSQLSKGNLNVTLKNVTLKDTGTYECMAVYEHEQKISQFIHLTVKPPVVSIKATEGEDTVLPCDGLKDAEVIVLQWTVLDQHKIMLLVRAGLVLIYPDYTDRVVLMDSQLKKGELSVGLRNVTLNDTGTYECIAVYKDDQGQREISQFIHLTVKPKDTSIRVNVGLVSGLIVGLTLIFIITVIVVVCYKYTHLNQQNLKQSQLSPSIPRTVDVRVQTSESESTTRSNSTLTLDISSDSFSHEPPLQDPLSTVTVPLLSSSVLSCTLRQSRSDLTLSDSDSENPPTAQISFPDVNLTVNQSYDQSHVTRTEPGLNQD